MLSSFRWVDDQVELDHARLAMLAVLLTGAVGAGVPTSTDFGEASVGLLNAVSIGCTNARLPCDEVPGASNAHASILEPAQEFSYATWSSRMHN